MPKRSAHDLNLPDWGPYSKRYAGISHIADPDKGVRFDISVFPGLYHGSVRVPSVNYESGWHPVAGSSDGSSYTYRHEVTSSLYCDITYTLFEDENGARISAKYYNSDISDCAATLHLCASIEVPSYRAYGSIFNPKIIQDIILPEGACAKNALEYTEFVYSIPRGLDALACDGMLRGEVHHDGMWLGKGLGHYENINQVNHDEVCDIAGPEGAFGEQAGDRVSYSVSMPTDASFVIRYRHSNPNPCNLTIRFGDKTKDISLPPCDNLTLFSCFLEGFSSGEGTLDIVTGGGSSVLFDTVCVCPINKVDQIEYTTRPTTMLPTSETYRDGILQLDYIQSRYSYAIKAPNENQCIHRHLHCDSVDTLLPFFAHEHLAMELYGRGEGYFSNLLVRPVSVPANGSCEIVLYVANAPKGDFPTDIFSNPKIKDVNTRFLARNNAGEPYSYGADLLSALALTNVTYPFQMRDENIKFNSCGRWWDTVYTWDGGFTGMALETLEPFRALDQLRAYLMPADDKHCSHIIHGSLVPTPFYLLKFICDRGLDTNTIKELYPSLRRYYQFFVGTDGTSNMSPFESGLLRPWDYTSNSGGWDDYPSQLKVFAENTLMDIAPCVTTSHGVRIAYIMAQIACRIDSSDKDEYLSDAERLLNSLEKYAYNDTEGYYSYIVHDKDGNVIGPMTDNDGSEINMGIDGVCPIICGRIDPSREQELVSHMMTPGHLWSPAGITAVDMRSSKFNPAGYWNGAVWFAHQWFFSQAMLDYGRADEFIKIADTATKLWNRQAELTSCCFEHFHALTGQGAGWHQFTALSSPELMWFESLYTPGTLTVGFDVSVSNLMCNDEKTTLECDLDIITNNRPSALIICMTEGHDYTASLGDSNLEICEVHKGTYKVLIPAEIKKCHLQIKEII